MKDSGNPSFREYRAVLSAIALARPGFLKLGRNSGDVPGQHDRVHRSA